MPFYLKFIEKFMKNAKIIESTNYKQTLSNLFKIFICFKILFINFKSLEFSYLGNFYLLFNFVFNSFFIILIFLLIFQNWKFLHKILILKWGYVQNGEISTRFLVADHIFYFFIDLGVGKLIQSSSNWNSIGILIESSKKNTLNFKEKFSCNKLL